MTHRKPDNTNVKYMLAGGSVIAAVGLLIDPQGLLPRPASPKDVCEEIVQPKSVLSRDELSQLLTVPERSKRTRVQQIVQAPYCKLKPLDLRAGSTAQREAYPLAFDPQTWFVVLYEGDEYAGYSFSFRH